MKKKKIQASYWFFSLIFLIIRFRYSFLSEAPQKRQVLGESHQEGHDVVSPSLSTMKLLFIWFLIKLSPTLSATSGYFLSVFFFCVHKLALCSKEELSLLPYLLIYVSMNSEVLTQWLRISTIIILCSQICPVGTLLRCFLYSVDIFPSFLKHFFTFWHKMLQTCLTLSQPVSEISFFPKNPGSF